MGESEVLRYDETVKHEERANRFVQAVKSEKVNKAGRNRQCFCLFSSFLDLLVASDAKIEM